MSTDRDLLERAAKAAGIVGEYESWTAQGFSEGIRQVLNGAKCHRPWNPIADDGDAFRVAVTLNLLVMPYPDDRAVRVVIWRAGHEPENITEAWGSPPDPAAATRRAIVRAAAALGSKG